jgi:hypothetical protein
MHHEFPDVVQKQHHRYLCERRSSSWCCAACAGNCVNTLKKCAGKGINGVLPCCSEKNWCVKDTKDYAQCRPKDMAIPKSFRSKSILTCSGFTPQGARACVYVWGIIHHE